MEKYIKLKIEVGTDSYYYFIQEQFFKKYEYDYYYCMSDVVLRNNEIIKNRFMLEEVFTKYLNDNEVEQ
ncbi:MAG: hypothetical protein RBT49_04620 [Bacteroidales bacterium]|jgi:hypothetical protein|nr:hypothetical protein [Bacteroidales bacterium]